jgi:hypothetical protein
MSPQRIAFVLMWAVIGMALGSLLADLGVPLPLGWAILAAVFGVIALWRSREESVRRGMRVSTLVLLVLVVAQVAVLLV